MEEREREAEELGSKWKTRGKGREAAPVRSILPSPSGPAQAKYPQKKPVLCPWPGTVNGDAMVADAAEESWRTEEFHFLLELLARNCRQEPGEFA